MFMISREKKKNPYLTPFGKFWITIIALILMSISAILALIVMLWDINITINAIVVGVK